MIQSLFLFFLCLSMYSAEPIVTKVACEQFEDLDLIMDRGEVVFEPVDGELAKVVYQVREKTSNKPINVEVVDGKLMIDASNEGGKGNHVDFHIFVPRTTNIRVKAGMVKMRAVALSGELQAEMGIGNINIHAPFSQVEMKMGKGKVSLDYPTIPQKRCNIKIKAGMAQVDIKLPDNAKVYELRDKHFLTSGRNDFTFVDKRKAHFLIDAKIGMGKINILKAVSKKTKND